MRVKICHSKYGVYFDGEAAKIEAIEQDDKIMYVLTGYDGSEREIIAENQYTVLRIGDKKKAQKKLVTLGYSKGPTTWDIAIRFDEAVKKLEENNVDTSKIYMCLPDENGWMKDYGPMSIDEARKLCEEYWRDKDDKTY